jgi:hypothetical protein
LPASYGLSGPGILELAFRKNPSFNLQSIASQNTVTFTVATVTTSKVSSFVVLMSWIRPSESVTLLHIWYNYLTDGSAQGNASA